MIFLLSIIVVKMIGKKHVWTRDSEILLIQEVKERPQLWDPSHSDYAKAYKKSIQWEEIAKKLSTFFDGKFLLYDSL